MECIAKELKRKGTYSDILTDRYMSDMVVAAYHHEWWNGKVFLSDGYWKMREIRKKKRNFIAFMVCF